MLIISLVTYGEASRSRPCFTVKTINTGLTYLRWPNQVTIYIGLPRHFLRNVLVQWLMVKDSIIRCSDKKNSSSTWSEVLGSWDPNPDFHWCPEFGVRGSEWSDPDSNIIFKIYIQFKKQCMHDKGEITNQQPLHSTCGELFFKIYFILLAQIFWGWRQKEVLSMYWISFWVFVYFVLYISFL